MGGGAAPLGGCMWIGGPIPGCIIMGGGGSWGGGGVGGTCRSNCGGGGVDGDGVKDVVDAVGA